MLFRSRIVKQFGRHKHPVLEYVTIDSPGIEIEAAAKLIANAKRPLLIAGGGWLTLSGNGPSVGDYATFILLATRLVGGQVNVTADLNGDIAGTNVLGTFDYETGVARCRFGAYVAAAGNESQPWYSADAVGDDGKIFKPAPVFADTIRYNAVGYTYLPLDADVIGMDPVRLPQDGRVTIIRTGVGSKPLHGLLICGQLDTSTRTSVSARSATRSPGADSPSTMPRVPSASTGTFMKKLRFGARSRFPRP